MADNTTLNPGSGGDVIATDDIAGVKYQVVKMGIGADGSVAFIAGDTTNGIDVDVTRIIPGTTATALGKAEDGFHTSGDTGVMALAVRADSGGPHAGTDGDYIPLITDATGNLRVNASGVAVPVTDNSGSLTVDNAGSFLVQVTPTSTSIGKFEDAAHTTGDAGVYCLAVRSDTAASTATTDGDYTSLITDSTGKLHVNVGNTVTVGSHAVTNAGTFAVQESGAALTALQLIDDTVFAEDVAAQAADKGIAVLAVRRDADTSLVGADNDYANLQVNASGSLKVAITAGAGSGGTSIADGASFTRDTTSITPVGAVVETSAPTLTNGDAAGLSMTTGGALRVAIASGGVAGVVEDAVASGSAEGILAVAVRDDSLTTLTPADGDYTCLRVSSTGALHVTGGGGGTEYTVDAAAPAAPTGATFVMERDDALSSLTEVEGDWTNPRSSANGALWVAVDGTVTVGSHAVTNAGTFAVQNTAATPAGTNNIGDVDVLTIAAGDNNIGNVDIVTMPNVTLAAGTNTNEVVGDAAHDAAAAGNPVLLGAYASAAAPSDVSADADAVRLWALRNGSQVVNLAYGGTLVTATTVQEIVGDVADDAATAGNPVLIGGVAVETDGTDPTTVSAEGDAAYLRTDRARRLLVSEHHPRSFFTSADYGSAQTNTSVQAAPGASLSLYITDIIISNGATAGNITLLDGSGGTVKFEIYPAINGGCTISLRNPIRLTANTALCITSTTVTTHSVNIGGYTAP